MNYAEKTAHDFLLKFLSLYLCSNDINAVLALLCDNIIWSGSNGKIAINKAEIRALLEKQFAKYPAAALVAENQFRSEAISDSTVFICGQYELNFDGGEPPKRLQTTVLCSLGAGGEYRIGKIHTTFFEHKGEKLAHKPSGCSKKAAPAESLEQQKQDLLLAYIELKRQNEELIRKNKKLVELTTMDIITRTYNQDVIIGFILAEMDRFSRYGHIFSLAAISIAGTKEPSGLAGSITGNLILKNTAHAIKKQLRKNDRLGRYIADRFLLVLPNTNLEGAEITCQRIKATVDELSAKKYSGNVAVNIGISEYNNSSVSLEQLVETSERQLEKAIKSGANIISIC